MFSRGIEFLSNLLGRNATTEGATEPLEQRAPEVRDESLVISGELLKIINQVGADLAKFLESPHASDSNKPFDTIPDELLSLIIEKMPTQYLGNCLRVSRRWVNPSKREYESRILTLNGLIDLVEELKPFVKKSDLEEMTDLRYKDECREPLGDNSADRCLLAVLIALANIGELNLFVEELKKQNNFLALDIIHNNKIKRFFDQKISSSKSLIMPPHISSPENHGLFCLAHDIDREHPMYGLVTSEDLEKMKPYFSSLYNAWEPIMENIPSKRLNAVLQALEKKGELYLFLKALQSAPENRRYQRVLEIIGSRDVAYMFIPSEEKSDATPIDILSLSPSKQLPLLDKLADEIEESGFTQEFLIDIKAIMQRNLRGNLEFLKNIILDKNVTRFYIRILLNNLHKNKLLNLFMSALGELQGTHEQYRNVINIINNHVTKDLFFKENDCVNKSWSSKKSLSWSWQLESFAYKLKELGFGKSILQEMANIESIYRNDPSPLFDSSHPILDSLMDMYGYGKMAEFKKALEKLSDKYEICREVINIINSDEDLKQLFE